jgi:hypothetical protein
MLLKDAERSLEYERQHKEILEKERWEILKEAGVQIPGNQKLEGYSLKGTFYFFLLKTEE